jgi:hypothetical protein
MENNNNNLIIKSYEKVHKDILDKLPENIAMITKVWGPPTWFFLHSMAMSYPKKINENNPEHRKRRNAMFQFLSNLGDILPCPICGVSYNTYIKDPYLSIWNHLNSRANLIEFIYKIHNKVNKKLGVPQCDIPSFKEVVEYYSQFIAGPCKATTDDERHQRLLLGCSNDDIEKGKFKNYSCSVNVIDKNNNSNVNILDNKENFGNVSNKENNSTLTIIFGILALVFFITTIILFIKLKKKY